ncbi:MAG: hypothetical protein FJY85_26270, partial [Deltaproteobacteria bacterium]|nr:hypothetical protein [Deltaproteobacteria bacterium]
MFLVEWLHGHLCRIRHLLDGGGVMMCDAGVVGIRVDQLDTPALLIDLPIMERNIELMAELFRG